MLYLDLNHTKNFVKNIPKAPFLYFIPGKWQNHMAKNPADFVSEYIEPFVAEHVTKDKEAQKYYNIGQNPITNPLSDKIKKLYSELDLTKDYVIFLEKEELREIINYLEYIYKNYNTKENFTFEEEDCE